MKLLRKIWARLTGAAGDTPIDSLGAGLDFGGVEPLTYYVPDDDGRPR